MEVSFFKKSIQHEISIYIDKILASNRSPCGEKCLRTSWCSAVKKNFCLSVPKMSGRIKRFDKAKSMSFFIKNKQLQKVFTFLCKYKVFTTNPWIIYHNKLLLQLKALSNSDNFTVITILYNNDELTRDNKNNNKCQVTMS